MKNDNPTLPPKFEFKVATTEDIELHHKAKLMARKERETSAKTRFLDDLAGRYVSLHPDIRGVWLNLQLTRIGKPSYFSIADGSWSEMRLSEDTDSFTISSDELFDAISNRLKRGI